MAPTYLCAITLLRTVAKTAGPLFSLSAHGSWASQITHLLQQSTTIAKRHSSPKGPPTALQLARRLWYRQQALAWHYLTDDQLAALRPISTANAITVFNAWIQQSMLLFSPGHSTTWDAARTLWDNGQTTWT